MHLPASLMAVALALAVAADASAADAAHGQELYESRCGGCHSLDAWLTNPQALIPGQRMNFRVATDEDRADIIAYLRQQSGK